MWVGRLTPKLVAVREEVREGAYMLILDFDISKDMTLEMWMDRKGTIQTFFGPGIKAEYHPREGVWRWLSCAMARGLGEAKHSSKKCFIPLCPGFPLVSRRLISD
jgi:hypothetical protein